jgi:two-component system OmpR family response regulator
MRPIAAHPLSDPYARSAVVIDRDPVHAAQLVTWLSQQGFRVFEARDGAAGVDAVATQRPDLILVQTDLPGLDGFETVRRMREFSDGFVILLSQDDSESAVVEGFRAGADDYIVTPLRPYALRARIDALMRRSRALAGATTHTSDMGWLEHNLLRMQPASRRVELHGIECELTRSEFDLLFTLVRAKDQVFSKSSLALMLREANGLPGQHITAHDRHAVEVHVMNLRRKLGDDPRAPRWIETVRGLGYRLAPASSSLRPGAPLLLQAAAG